MIDLNRRTFLKGAALAGLGQVARTPMFAEAPVADFPSPAPLEFLSEKSGLKITAIRPVNPKPKRPLPSYSPAQGSWSTGGVEVANPMSIYPKFKPQRSLFFADNLGPSAVVVETDRGIRGIGFGGPGASFVVERHFPKLLIGEDPFQVERLWDIMWRSTLYYGRKGLVVHAISAVDNALWDIIGQATGKPVYKLLGGATRQSVPGYCTGNDVEHAVKFGFRKIKLALPYGPADGETGLVANEKLVAKTREILGQEGEIMLDCWMALTENYAAELARRLEPHRVYWMEECLMPDDYAGMRRLNAAVTSTRMATGEHEYTRYGFKQLLDNQAADLWQPDMLWCGGLTELRHIGALAKANRIPVILHGGWRDGGTHYVIADENSPWCEMFLPPPGGPKEAYARFEEDNQITRGPEGIYTRPPDRPGFGFDLEID
ncbi:MAG: L-rhamnonate dehydratase [Verrucomicrobia bacterium]|nr:L-rhamnonate dehydratase [Verrucomicrobiota bacterium]